MNIYKYGIGIRSLTTSTLAMTNQQESGPSEVEAELQAEASYAWEVEPYVGLPEHQSLYPAI